MLTMLSAYTLEADDAAFALNEILRQLQPEKRLKKHSVGLLYCHPDFMETGVAQAISEKLPFDVIGGTFLANMASGIDDPLMLTLSVLTSDDIQFSTLCAGNLEKENAVAEAYGQAAKGHSGAPGLILSFVPLKISVGVEPLIAQFDQTSGGAPVFGAVSVDHTSDRSRCFTVYNGREGQDLLVAALLWGEVNPSFYVANMSEKYVQRQRAVITKAHGNVLEEVNDMPFTEYLASIGAGNGAGEMAGVPFIVNYNDGTKPVVRDIHTVSTDGYAVCNGTMPENGTLTIGSVEEGDVLRMTEEAMKAVLNSGKTQGCLMHPCVSHFLTMDADATKQKSIALGLMPEGLPFQWGYSAGEICPVFDEAGNLHNRFHSFTFVVCVF